MASVTISLSDQALALAERRVREHSYEDLADYLGALIEQDVEEEEAEGDWELDEETCRLIEEAEASGFSEKTPEEIFAEARARYFSG